MKKYLARFQKFRSKNDGKVVSAFSREILSRWYCKAWVRRFVAPFYSTREPEKWVFLVGCYNSGTTILREVLGAHPHISTLPREGVRFTKVFPFMESNGWVRMWAKNPDATFLPEHTTEETVKTLKENWAPWWKNDATCYLEKSITHCGRMQWLNEHFENAHFIAITRNGYCAAEGIRRRAKPSGSAREQCGDRYPMDYVAKQWVDANVCLSEGRDTVDHCFDITYEDLVDDAYGNCLAILNYLDLDTSYLKRMEGGIMMGKRSFEIKNMNESSIARLSRDDIANYNAIAGEMMEQLGYQVLKES